MEHASRHRAPVSATLVVALLGACVSLAAAADPAPGDPSAVTAAEAPFHRIRPGLDELRRLFASRDYALYEERARALLAEASERYGEDSLEAARLMEALAKGTAKRGGDSGPESMARLLRSLRIQEEVLGPDHAAIGPVLQTLASAHRAAGEMDRARAAMSRSLAIRRRHADLDPGALVSSLLSMGGMEDYLAQPESSLVRYHEAAHILRTRLPEKRRTLARMLTNRGIAEMRLGRNDDACRSFEGAEGIFEEECGPASPDLAQALQNHSLALRRAGRPRAAIRVARRSLAIHEASGSGESTLAGRVCVSLANLLLDAQNTDEARGLYERAATLFSDAGHGRSPSMSIILQNLAILHYRTGNARAADSIAQQTRDIVEGAYGPDHERVAPVLSLLSNLAMERGELDRAREYIERSLGLIESARGPDDPDLAIPLVTLGKLLVREGDPAAACASYERSLAFRREANGRLHPNIPGTLLYAAHASAALGDTLRAVSHALEAEGLSRERFRLTIHAFGEGAALRYAASRESGVDAALGVLSTEPGPEVSDALTALAGSRALVMDELARRRRAARVTGAPGAAALADSVADVVTHLAGLTLRGPGGDDAGFMATIEELRRKKERLEIQLGETAPATRLKPGEGTAMDLARALPPETALVSYYRYLPDLQKGAPEYGAFVLCGPGSPPRFVRLGSAAAIDSAVMHWRTRIELGGRGLFERSAERTCREAGSAVRRSIWDPLIRYCPDAREVLIVPDGTLHFISFDALPADSARYLLETGVRTRVLSAERDLLQTKERESPGRGILALGGADYGREEERNTSPRAPVALASGRAATFRGGHTQKPGFASLHFEPLPGTRREADAIAAAWEAPQESSGTRDTATVLHGHDATEEAFRRLAPGTRILHLATHGFFLGGNPCDRGAEDRKAETSAGMSLIENPLLLSGLAFAGANRRADAPPGTDDGILTAEEIATLDLTGVQCAVLSACGTGLGKIHSREGVLGLRRAFRIAGAEAIVMSLWDVEDAATRLWMGHFYDAMLTEELPPAEAARRASLAALARLRKAGRPTHPFDWAGFIVEGPPPRRGAPREGSAGD
jgi:CHAT domain-containing protein